MKIGRIYKITNIINNKQYVGQTTGTLKRRFKRHIEDRTCKSNIALRKALNEYGCQNFIIELVEDNIPEHLLDEKEVYYIKYFNTFEDGYNMTIGGKGGNTYAKKTQEEMNVISKKISESKIGDKNPMRIYGGLKGERNGMYGKTPHNATPIMYKNIKTNEIFMFDSIGKSLEFWNQIRPIKKGIRNLLKDNNDELYIGDFYITTHIEGVETIESII